MHKSATNKNKIFMFIVKFLCLTKTLRAFKSTTQQSKGSQTTKISRHKLRIFNNIS